MASPTRRTPRLGRGLSSLIGQPVPVITPQGVPPTAAQPPADSAYQDQTPPSLAPAVAIPATPQPAEVIADGQSLVHIPIASIRPNPHQPRQRFAQASLQSLADSIRSEGVMQPIIVRPAPAPGSASGSAPESVPGSAPILGKAIVDGPVFSSVRGTDKPLYEIVAGERRWRAAQLAGLTHLPAIIRDLDERQLAEWALIENLQREDLNALERAGAFRNLADHFGLSHDQIAQRVGVERSSVSNYLRLLDLEEHVQQAVRDRLLAMGHARALAAVTDPLQQKSLAEKAIRQQWSVRQLEQAVRKWSQASNSTGQNAAKSLSARSAHFADLEAQIGRHLHTRVHISPARKKGAGNLIIEFYTIGDFEQLLNKLGLHPE